MAQEALKEEDVEDEEDPDVSVAGGRKVVLTVILDIYRAD